MSLPIKDENHEGRNIRSIADLNIEFQFDILDMFARTTWEDHPDRIEDCDDPEWIAPEWIGFEYSETAGSNETSDGPGLRGEKHSCSRRS